MPWTAPNCWEAIADYEKVAEANTKIAQLNADALRDTEEAYDAILRAGKSQQEYAELREDMLQEERRQHTYDNWFYRGVLVLGGIAVIATR